MKPSASDGAWTDPRVRRRRASHSTSDLHHQYAGERQSRLPPLADTACLSTLIRSGLAQETAPHVRFSDDSVLEDSSTPHLQSHPPPPSAFNGTSSSRDGCAPPRRRSRTSLDARPTSTELRQDAAPSQKSPASSLTQSCAVPAGVRSDRRPTRFARLLGWRSVPPAGGICVPSAGTHGAEDVDEPHDNAGDKAGDLGHASPDAGAPSGAVRNESLTPAAIDHRQAWPAGSRDIFGLAPLLRHGRSYMARVVHHISGTPEPSRTQKGRRIVLDVKRMGSLIDERHQRQYPPNAIRSSRYTLWNFVPRQLFAQFSKLANFYFLCVSILQMVPSLSTTGTYTTIAPLLFFVSLSMAKEGYEDLRRYRLDRVENNREATVLRPSTSASSLPSPDRDLPPDPDCPAWTSVAWSQVEVGDVVRVARDEPVPADLVLLRARGPAGLAYVETTALDGETNLKSKRSTPALIEACATDAGLARCPAHFVAEDPNLDLYRFEGLVTVLDETQPLCNDQILYRGSVLRNTVEAVGLVLYSGEECKIRMNATKNPRVKAPSLQASVNKVVLVIVCFVLTLAGFNTGAHFLWSSQVERRSWYLINASVPFFPILASFVIMFNTMIPLSLYVSLEIIKLVQVFLMQDVDMYDAASNIPMEARTSTINEELGQVTHIFSDKTGTLTDNSMRFRKLTVSGTAWAHDLDVEEHPPAGRDDRHRPRHRLGKHGSCSAGEGSLDLSSADGAPDGSSSTAPSAASSRLTTGDLRRIMRADPSSALAQQARFLILALSLCHTCLPEQHPDGRITYQAASPDEIALVQAAREMGVALLERDADSVTLRIDLIGSLAGVVTESYQILDVIEFSSRRKRMSVVVRLPDRRICLITKGADSTVMQLLRSSKLAQAKAVEIERRADHRKSVEAEAALRRNGSVTDREPHDILVMGRAGSIDRRRRQSMREEVDAWLTSRENDVAIPMDEIEPVTSPSSPAAPRHESAGLSAIREAKVADEGPIFERCFQHVDDFASEGLRTLLYGYRHVDEDEYLVWKKTYATASTTLVDRQAAVERAGALIERDLELAGATAIEDRLQEGVPEAIDKLRRAGIKVWMLTGDKRGTAINIGHACRLIKDYSSVTVLDQHDRGLEERVSQAILESRQGCVAHAVLVVEGETLTALEGSTAMELFVDLALLSDSVICCRASPSQKASLVRLIRMRHPSSVTLAIGDGANDVAMIQEAHVGIGIAGKEGFQAARISDYSIAQFRFLLKLLLVHGRWNYIRTCKYTLSTFWKEMLFYLTQALFQRYNGYTGTSLYESWSLTMFNTLFTSLPVIALGAFEKDLAASTLLAVPELYSKGRRREAFNFLVYLGWVFLASTEAMIVYFFMLYLFGRSFAGIDSGLFALGVMTFSACIVIISVKILFIEMHHKSIVAIIAFCLSVGGWFLWNILLSAIYRNNTVYSVRGGILHRFGGEASWWLVLVAVVLACVVFELGVISLRAAWFPTDVDIFQEYEQDPALRRRFEEASSRELEQSRKHLRCHGQIRGTEGPTGCDLDRPKRLEEGR